MSLINHQHVIKTSGPFWHLLKISYFDNGGKANGVTIRFYGWDCLFLGDDEAGLSAKTLERL
jgi:hypothetical protein